MSNALRWFRRQSRARNRTPIVEQGLTVLRISPTGAPWAGSELSDGAGCLIQIPDRFFREVMAKQGVNFLQQANTCRHGILPRDPPRALPAIRDRARDQDEGQFCSLARCAGDNGDLAEPAKRSSR